MWRTVDRHTGPRFVTWAQITGKPGATAGQLQVDGAPLPVGVQTLGGNGVLWTSFDGAKTEALALGGRATLSAEGVQLEPHDPCEADFTCAFCKATSEGAELYGWRRPPEGWLACGVLLACSAACALGCDLEIGVAL